MFNFLANRITKSINKIAKKTLISEEDIVEVSREIKLSLLEADVNLSIVKKFVKNVREKAINANIHSSLNASQQFIKIVKDELVDVLGKTPQKINIEHKPHIIMMVGLQGSGKTTTAAKLAFFHRKKKLVEKPILIAADVYRPAAIEQLVTLAKNVSIDYYEEGVKEDIVGIVKNGLKKAKANNHDMIIVDTAGRLSIDEKLMNELVEIKKAIKPDEIIFVADAMSGQDIVNVAQTFHDRLKLTSSIITKLDGDARGGAALSIRELLKLPIKFIGTGENISNIDLFYPERMAERILGMGDVLSLIEQAQDVIDEKKANKMMNRFVTGQFTLNDLLENLQQMKKMGKLSKILQMIPGANKISQDKINAAEKKSYVYEILISSMTAAERKNPKLLKDASRKNRVIKGSGRSRQEFNLLLSEYEQMASKVKSISKSIKGGTFDPSQLSGAGGIF
ncbi:signal recognition particle protein [Mycoplasmopsis californica]|uniref:Signal recognition particle protein n=1 Tax=Mycoplasmopsis equigenitalium TaxID=114883 RepID=A0ABY5J391_9BACT|nr:signal recognition particle protein [Mycoplasmopsis equigenitalium]UUD37001.1 signal recognition particle protein [Mycoplasmopsis equigenitalium]VEU69701.1 signal recognition particle protein [Mycoplasmopsis californica]